MKHKLKNKYLLPIVLFAIIDLLLFFSSYFYIQPLVRLFNLPIILFVNIAISWLVASSLPKKAGKKILFIIFASLFNSFIGVLLIISTMYLPGSREHNYVMNHVCLPAMKDYYNIKENENFPNSGQYDKHMKQKWWYQHLECEQNVWNGKGPVFSENPPGFFPIKK